MTLDRASAIYSIVNEIEDHWHALEKITDEEAREIEAEKQAAGTLGAALVDTQNLTALRAARHALETAAQLLTEAAIG